MPDNKSIGERTNTLLEEWKKLNLTKPAQFLSFEEFKKKWTESNKEQEDNRFNRS